MYIYIMLMQTMEAPVVWDAMILKLIPLACVDSLPSYGTNYFRQQWLRHWLDAYGPKPLPEPMVI